ncbi:MAG TPA: PEP-CTERM sorting domain-containing protein, partial [Steroidobacteraceae bacterium]
TGTRITSATATTANGIANLSPQGFFFANPTTLYVADTGDPKSAGLSDGGLQKWTYSTASNSWVLDYTLTSSNFVLPTNTASALSGETGLASITGEVLPNGTVELFGTSYTAGDDNPDGLYGFVDTLSNTSASAVAGESLTELASSATDSDFKGVVFIPAAVPEPSSWALAALAVAGFAWLRRKTGARS